MKKVHGHTFFTASETAKSIGITVRSLDRHVEIAEQQAQNTGEIPAITFKNKTFKLHPRKLNTRHFFRVEEVLDVVKSIYGLDITVDDLIKYVSPKKVASDQSPSPTSLGCTP